MSNTSTVERRNVLGTLENADSVTVGIVRDADSASILAPTATGITNPSTGVYSYSYAALLLDPAQSYTLTWTFVKALNPTQTLTVPINAADQSRTLRGLRRALAAELGRYQLVAVTTTDTSSDAARTLICDELADDRGDSTKYGGIYAYIASGALAGQQRRVRSNGYTAASGALTVRRPFTAAPTITTQVELHGRLPAFTADGVMGLRECINRALKVTYHPQRLEVDAVAGAQNYSLTPFPSIRHEQQIGGEYDPSTSASLNPVFSADGAHLRVDADTPALEVDGAWNAGQTFQIEASIPNLNFVYSGGGWGYSTVGLQADDDQTLGDEILIVAVAKAYAYQALEVAGAEADGMPWHQRYLEQERRAMVIRESRQDKLAATGVTATEHAPGERRATLINRGRLWGSRGVR